MINLRESITLPHGLKNFTNLELYFIISKIFGLGGFGENLIEKERLFLCMSEAHTLRFIFISTLPIICETQTAPETSVCFGEFEEGFGDIEIYESFVPYSLLSAEQFDLSKINFTDLLKETRVVSVNPVELIEFLLNIVNFTDIKSRQINPLFEVSEEDELPVHFKYQFQIEAKNSYYTKGKKDLSGTYYLVVEPIEPFTENDVRGVNIYDYMFNETGQAQINTTAISPTKMKNLEAF
jgi:hypothetical protein